MKGSLAIRSAASPKPFCLSTRRRLVTLKKDWNRSMSSQNLCASMREGNVFNYFFISLPGPGSDCQPLASLFRRCRSHNRIIFDIYYKETKGDDRAEAKYVHELVINNLLYSSAHIFHNCALGDLWRSLSPFLEWKWVECLRVDKTSSKAAIVSLRKVQGKNIPRQQLKHENLFHFLLLLSRHQIGCREALFFFLFTVDDDANAMH